MKSVDFIKLIKEKIKKTIEEEKSTIDFFEFEEFLSKNISLLKEHAAATIKFVVESIDKGNEISKFRPLETIVKLLESHEGDDESTLQHALNTLHASLTSAKDQGTKIAIIHGLFDTKSNSFDQTLIELALEQKEPLNIRLIALSYIKDKKINKSHYALLLKILKENPPENDDWSVFDRSLSIVEKKGKDFEALITHIALEEFVYRDDIAVNVRNRAIELLGHFGDIDTFERVFVISKKYGASSNLAMQSMLERLLNKPINVLSIRPETFEKLIKELLIKKEYQRVSVTRFVKDGGVDVVAYKSQKLKKEPSKIIAQCKRYSRNLINKDVVEKLVNDIRDHKAKEGILITTSDFTKCAKEYAENHQYLTLINRGELQILLDNAFGEGKYTIKDNSLNN